MKIEDCYRVGVKVCGQFVLRKMYIFEIVFCDFNYIFMDIVKMELYYYGYSVIKFVGEGVYVKVKLVEVMVKKLVWNEVLVDMVEIINVLMVCVKFDKYQIISQVLV